MTEDATLSEFLSGGKDGEDDATSDAAETPRTADSASGDEATTKSDGEHTTELEPNGAATIGPEPNDGESIETQSIDDDTVGQESNGGDSVDSEPDDDGPTEAESSDDGRTAHSDGEAERAASLAATEGEPSPATPTYGWGEYTCARCDEAVDRVWNEEGEFVCSACKPW